MVTKTPKPTENIQAKRARKSSKLLEVDSKEWDRRLIGELGRCASCGGRCQNTICRRCSQKQVSRDLLPDRRRNGEGFERHETIDDDERGIEADAELQPRWRGGHTARFKGRGRPKG